MVLFWQVRGFCLLPQLGILMIPYRTRRAFAAAMLLLLSACSEESRPEWVNTLTGKPNRSYNNFAIGPKHPPVLNPKPGSLQRPPGMSPSLENNPYDYFDTIGNPATIAPAPPPVPPAAAPAPMPPSTEGDGHSSAPMKKGAIASRKSFPVNLPYPGESSPAAAESQSAIQVPPPMPVATSSAPAAKLPPNVAAASYPDLSSVPYIPPELREAKAKRDAEQRGLEKEHAKADQKKEALEQGFILEGMPWQTSASSQAPVMLGHAYDTAPASGYAERQRTLQQTTIATPAEY